MNELASIATGEYDIHEQRNGLSRRAMIQTSLGLSTTTAILGPAQFLDIFVHLHTKQLNRLLASSNIGFSAQLTFFGDALSSRVAEPPSHVAPSSKTSRMPAVD